MAGWHVVPQTSMTCWWSQPQQGEELVGPPLHGLLGRPHDPLSLGFFIFQMSQGYCEDGDSTREHERLVPALWPLQTLILSISVTLGKSPHF